MACGRCGTAAPAGARFCPACGAALPLACGKCGATAQAGARFCSACGEPLPTGAPAAREPVQAPEERRLVTVLFADLSGWTAVSERLDPEVAKRVSETTLLRLKDEVDRHGGAIDKFAGDGLMALFGAPLAHEDDAERAVRAGLAMQAAMREVNDGLDSVGGASFSLRVGINTGEVLAGAVGERYTVTGDAVNTAARLESACRPGRVTVGRRTHEATLEAFAYRELEPLKLKGKADPVPAWEATAAVADLPARRAVRSETPFVGREAQLRLIPESQARTVQERGAHLLTVVGGAGVGKSRLMREAAAGLAAASGGPRLLEGRCPAYGSGIVYWALGEVFRADAEIRDGDPSDLAWEKLRARLADLLGGDPAVAERRAALVGRLLGMEVPEGLEAVEPDAERARDAAFAAVAACLEAMAARRPLVVIFEDVHWADDGLLDLVQHVTAFVRAPLLVVCLARDELLERRPGWGAARRLGTLAFLEPLSERETHELLASLLPDGDGERASALAERAEGNALFAEEMARRVREHGDAGAAELPDTVQGVLAARLDSLPALERRFLQHAAVIGRTFSAEELEPLAAEGIDVPATLAVLREKDLIVPEGHATAGAEMAFRHVLIRDVAYATLPMGVRARKHHQVGELLARRAGDRGDEVVALLAEHFGRAATLAIEAGLPAEEVARLGERALELHEAAGDAAAEIYANREALDRYVAALDERLGADSATRARLNEKRADVEARIGRLDEALVGWRSALAAAEGEGDRATEARLLRKLGAGLGRAGRRAEAVEHLQRGIAAVKDAPPSLDLVSLYEEAALLYLENGDNMLAVYAAEKALRLTERVGEPRAASRAHAVFGRVLGRMGDAERARESLERSVELVRGDDAGTLVALVELARHHESVEAGYEAARAAYEDALAIAERLGGVLDQVEILLELAQLAVVRADWAQAAARREAVDRLGGTEARSRRRALMLGLSAVEAWRLRRFEEAEGLYAEALELTEEGGWTEVRATLLHGQALLRRDREDPEGAIDVLGEALDACARAGMSARAVQLHALRAEVLAGAGRQEEARAETAAAVEAARGVADPVARVAAREAQGFVAADAGALEESAEWWGALGRPLDAARCALLRAGVLAAAGSEEAAAARASAVAELERLGVTRLAADGDTGATEPGR
ncbi:MAG: adenylate/guanylate cyclase domain-containing protein [Solirubrobacteraceae bacterium]